MAQSIRMMTAAHGRGPTLCVGPLFLLVRAEDFLPEIDRT